MKITQTLMAATASSAQTDIAARGLSEPSAACLDTPGPASNNDVAIMSVFDPLDYFGAIRNAVEDCLKQEELEKYRAPRQRVEFPVASNSGCCHDGFVAALREENRLLEKRVAFLEHALEKSDLSRASVRWNEENK